MGKDDVFNKMVTEPPFFEDILIWFSFQLRDLITKELWFYVSVFFS